MAQNDPIIDCVRALREGQCSEEQVVEVLAFAASSRSSHEQRSDIVPGWDPELRELFDELALHMPDVLRGHGETFTSNGKEQLQFALALKGHGEWPARAMPSLARQFLNCPPGTFAYENQIPTETLRTAATQLLKSEPVPVLQWCRLESLLPQADDEFRRLALFNYCGQDFRSKAFLLAANSSEGFAPSLLAVLEDGSLSFTGAVAASLVLTAEFGEAWGTKVPSRVLQALSWDLRCGNDVEANVSLQAYSHLNTVVAGDLLRQCLGEPRAIALIPAIEDDRVIGDLLGRLAAGTEPDAVIVDALVACGSRAGDALVQACRSKKVATSVGLVAAEVLGRLATTELQTLVALLAHPSKRVSSASAKSLARLDEEAREALETGAQSNKKTIRSQCERLLKSLSEKQTDVTTPLTGVRARTEQMQEAERNAFIALWNAAGHSEANWQGQLKPEVQRLGATSLELLRDWFVAGLEDGETRLWCYAVEELRSDPEAVWVAVDTFARMPKLGASLWARPRRALSHCGHLLGPPIVHALRSVHTEYREALFGLLASHAADFDQNIFLTGLSDPSKTVRTHSLDGLSRIKDGPLNEVAKLLSSSVIGTRVAAAELLAVWGRREVAAQVVEAWGSERSKAVRPYLEDTLVACGRADLLFHSKPGAPLDFAAAERDLLQQRLPSKQPSFIRLQELPRLRFSDGSVAPAQLRAGFLARLMKLELNLKGRALRRLLPLFQVEDVRAWSRHIYAGWSIARSPKHKWAILQLSLLAEDALLSEALSQLAEWKGTEHAAVACHLRAAQWHGSDTSMQWLGYWSENLSSFGGRSTARQSFERVAFKRQCSTARLRRELNPFIGEKFWERKEEEARTGFSRHRLMSELSRSWLSGRDWTAESVSKRLYGPGRAGPELLWCTVRGQACRLEPQADGGFILRLLDGSALKPKARVRLLHPLELTLDELERCRAANLGPTELPQLDRDCFDDSQLSELIGVSCSGNQFAQWRRHERWFHGEPMDGGIVYTNSLHLLKHDLIVTLHHSGYGIGAAEAVDDVRVLGLDFRNLDDRNIEAKELPPLVYSELHYSIRRLSDPEG